MKTIFIVGFFSAFGLGVWLGYVIGWSRGFRQWRKQMEDTVLTGLGFNKDGKRVAPEDIFVP